MINNHPENASVIPFAVLESIDQELVAERDRANAEGPGVWYERLRKEAIRRMMKATGAAREAVERDLDRYLAMSEEDTITTLERIVYQQRFLAKTER